MQRFWNWLRGLRPVTRRQMTANVQAAVADERERALVQHARELTVERERHRVEIDRAHREVDNIIKQLSQVEWDREPTREYYRISLTVSPHLVRCHVGSTSDQLEILAESFSRQVYHEIRTAKFIQSARDRERELARAAVRDRPFV